MPPLCGWVGDDGHLIYGGGVGATTTAVDRQGGVVQDVNRCNKSSVYGWLTVTVVEEGGSQHVFGN